jgi:cysteine sulfinate desulfinase/cysteine desulfurase-like protein
MRVPVRYQLVIYLDHNATTPILPEVVEAMSLSKEVRS